MKLKEKFFKKFLEKPINDVIFVCYELYKNSCLVYLDEKNILSLEEFATLVNDKLKELYQ